MFEILGEDVWADILLRLPIKTLVLCACTSKTLNSFITSPDFVAAHNKKSKDKPFVFIRSYAEPENKIDYGIQHFCVHPDDESSGWNFMMMKMPLKTYGGECFRILGSCNGVICLCDDLGAKTNDYYLWNPSIHKYIKLPYPKVSYFDYGEYERCLGFGFDELTNDYKVVRLAYLENYDSDGGFNLVVPPLVEVYTVKSGSWKFIQDSSVKLQAEQEHLPCFFKGAIHWLATQVYGYWCAILTFDVSDESFGEIKLPPSFEGSSADGGCSVKRAKLSLRTCWGMLALVHLDSTNFFPSYSENNCCHIWVMNDYGEPSSWTKIFTITHPIWNHNLMSLSFRKNRDIIMLKRKTWVEHFFVHKESVVMLSVKIDGGTTEELRTFLGPLRGFYMDSYEEGLALFNEGISTLAEADVIEDDVEDDNADDSSENEAEEL